jgi:hypothetical protein
MCHRCATLSFEVDLALDRTVSPNETHNEFWRMFHGWMLRIAIEQEGSEPMFKEWRILRRLTLEGQRHNVDPKVLALALVEFFTE